MRRSPSRAPKPCRLNWVPEERCPQLVDLRFNRGPQACEIRHTRLGRTLWLDLRALGLERLEFAFCDGQSTRRDGEIDDPLDLDLELNQAAAVALGIVGGELIASTLAF